MKDNAYRQDIVSVFREWCLITVSIITMRSIGYLPQTLRPIVYALQNLDRNFANLVAPPKNASYAKCLVRYKVHLVP